MKSKIILSKLVRMLEKIRRELAVYHKLADFDPGDEMKHALVDMFVALIIFWTEAVKFLRNSTAGEVMSLHSTHKPVDSLTRMPFLESTIASQWPTLNKEFDVAVERMKVTIEHIYRVAAITDKADMKRHQESELLSMMDINEESTASFPCYEVPLTNPHFYARTKELAKLKEFFNPVNAGPSLRSFVVFGLGGVGKTALAYAFVDSCKESRAYDAIFWIRSATSAEIRESFTDICLRLDLPQATKTTENDTNVLLVKNWLEKTSEFLI